MSQRICAGIILFNPDLERLQKSIISVSSQVDSVFIVDNGSSNIVEIELLLKSIKFVVFIKNSENKGIACALNQLCIKALQMQFDWILTMDQDTVLEQNTVSMMESYCSHLENGIICPTVYYEGWKKRPSISNTITYVKACMTSGSLTRLSAWKMVDGFREDFFIDYVDNDFCQKLIISGYRIIRSNNCIMNHQLGELREIRLFGFKKIFITHSPWRYYYMIRNNIVFIRSYKSYLSIVKEFIKLIYNMLYGIISSKNKLDTIHFILLGIKDANKGLMGKMIMES